MKIKIKKWLRSLGPAVLPLLMLPPATASEEMLHAPTFSQLMIDRLEHRWSEGREYSVWHARAWFGGDYHRAVLKTDGVYSNPKGLETVQAQLLYARLISPFWELQAGLRYDQRPAPSRAYAVLGVQGLAPYWFEIDAAAFVSEQGDVSAKFEAEHDVLITQRLILQPRAELHAAAQAVPALGIGQGINDIGIGLRLRYEIEREFAPYVGVTWARSMGGSASHVRATGAPPEATAILAGVRLWW